MNSISLSKLAVGAFVVVGLLGLTSAAHSAQRRNPKHPAPPHQKGPIRRQPPTRTPSPPSAPRRDPVPPSSGIHTEPVEPASPSVTFTTTSYGRVYDNGIRLRREAPVQYTTLYAYFPTGVAAYSHYMPNYVQGGVYISPYGYFFGEAAPYVNPASVYLTSSPAQIVENPVMDEGTCNGFEETQSANWFDRTDLADAEPGLGEAIDKIVQTYQTAEIDRLVPLISSQVPVSVYLKGNYRYALPDNDFVDLTADALRTIKRVSLHLDTLRQRSENSFAVSGAESYRDPSGDVRSVFMSFGLQRRDGAWILTQIGTAPDQVQPWQ